MSNRTKGLGVAGYIGEPVTFLFVPDATFKVELDALVEAKTAITNTKLVGFTWLNAYEVTSPADDAIPDGIITDIYEDTASPYYWLTARIFRYLDQNGVSHTPVTIQNLAYSGTLALQDSIIVNGTTYLNVDDGGTGGWGAVIGMDLPASGRVDVIF